MSGLSCLILDCDGVLVDSEIIVARVAAACFRSAGAPISVDDMITRYAGITAPKVTEMVFEEYGMAPPPGATEQRRVAIMAALEREVQPMADVDEVLSSITVAKCVASSSHPERLALTLKTTELAHHFGDSVFSAFMVTNGKPAPDLFLLAAERMAVRPGQCVVVEDSVAGVIAGKAARMRVIGFVGGSHCRPDHAARLAELGADVVISEMTELAAALAS